MFLVAGVGMVQTSSMKAAATTAADGQNELLGFMAVYRFYAFPVDRCRLRLSQLVTLPSFRRKGVGALMMRALYRSASDPKQRGGLSVVDVSFLPRRPRRPTGGRRGSGGRL